MNNGPYTITASVPGYLTPTPIKASELVRSTLARANKAVTLLKPEFRTYGSTITVKGKGPKVKTYFRTSEEWIEIA